MVTCKKFLEELNNFLDEAIDPALKAEIQHHLDQCPNCFVICDTTKRTISVYKGMQPKALPEKIRSRLMSLIDQKCKKKAGEAHAAEASGTQARS